MCRTQQPPFFGGTYRFQLLPTDAAPVPLAAKISTLEAELTARGYDDTLNHYRQAHDNLLHRNYEAANGQLRTALEDLVTRLARQHTGYVGQRKPGGRRQRHQPHDRHGEPATPPRRDAAYWPLWVGGPSPGASARLNDAHHALGEACRAASARRLPDWVRSPTKADATKVSMLPRPC
jgi:hypothetical protein